MLSKIPGIAFKLKNEIKVNDNEEYDKNLDIPFRVGKIDRRKDTVCWILAYQ